MEDSAVEQCHRARPRPHLLPGLCRCGRSLLLREGTWKSCMRGKTKTWTDFKVPEDAIGCGFHEAVRGVLSHHVVIRDGKIANYHPYPPTPGMPTRATFTAPRSLRRCGAEHADFRGERAGQIQGHRHHARGAQLRSLPALRRPYVPGRRQMLETRHSPMFGVMGSK